MGLTLVAASQIAGAGGFGLGLYNLWHGWRKPVFDEQRALRGDLLEILQEMNDELLATQTRLQVKEVYYAPDPMRKLSGNRSKASKLGGRLISPGGHAMTLLDVAVGAAITDWEAIERHYYRQLEDSPQFHIDLDKLVEKARGSVGHAQTRVQAFITKVNDINKSKPFVYRNMKGDRAKV